MASIADKCERLIHDCWDWENQFDPERRREEIKEQSFRVNDEINPLLRELINQDRVDNVPDNYNDKIAGKNGCKALSKHEKVEVLVYLDWAVIDDSSDSDASESPFKDEDSGSRQTDIEASTDDSDSETVSVDIDTSGMGDLEKGIADAFQDAISIDKSDIQSDIQGEIKDLKRDVEDKLEELENRTPRTIEIINGDDQTTIDDYTHRKFDDVLTYVSCGDPVYLKGPSGTGKTHAAKQIADALDVDFYQESIAADTDSWTFKGYTSEDGEYVPTSFYEAYTNGGLMLLDEFDTGSSSLLKWLNSAVENGEASFPCGMVEQHEDFYLIATANTWGRGATRDYNAGNRLDASIPNRFTRVYWGYDKQLEKNVAGDTPWTRYVQELREAVEDTDVEAVYNIRQMEKGNQYLELGQDWERVEDVLLFNDLPERDVDKLTGNVERDSFKNDFQNVA